MRDADDGHIISEDFGFKRPEDAVEEPLEEVNEDGDDTPAPGVDMNKLLRALRSSDK